MFKWLFIIIIVMAIWGGVSGSFSLKSTKDSYQISIDKEKAVNSLKSGFDKTKTLVTNIDKVVEGVQDKEGKKETTTTEK